MRVCFVVGTLGRGGAERQLVFMLQALQEVGIKTRLLCMTEGESFEKDVSALGINIEWVGTSQNRIQRLRKIIKTIRNNPVDIVQSSHFYTNIYAAMAGRILGIRNIGAIRSDLYSELAADHIFGRWQIALPQHLIANSEIASKRAFERGLKRQRIDVVRNVVDLPVMSADRDLDVKKGLNILFVGRLGKEKRAELFIETARQLRLDLPHEDLTFQVAGEGPARFELEKLRDDYGFSRTEIMFLGEQSDLSTIYRNADILVLTSEYEGTPNVVLEAMAYGIPVVATRVGGVREVLSEKSGILVGPYDFEGLVDATTKLILNSELRRALGQHGRNYVAKNNSLEYLKRRLPGIYRKLLGISHTDD